MNKGFKKEMATTLHIVYGGLHYGNEYFSFK